MPSRRFPIDQLPAELQHALFALSGKEDVPNLRLTCKSLATVGRDYLVRKVELSFTLENFDRLSMITQHIGRHVKSLVYHIDLLPWYSDQSEYQNNVLGAKNYSPQQLAIGWKAYCALWYEQASLRKSNYGGAEIVTMISQMPQLKHITLANGYSLRLRTLNFKAAYAKTLLPVGIYNVNQETSGLPQLFPIVEALRYAGSSIESFRAGPIEFAVFHDADTDTNDQDHGMEDDQCRLYLEEGDHLELLRSMIRLENLNLSFAPSIDAHWDMKLVFKDLLWPCLRALTLHDYKGTDQDLLDLLGRHAATLKSLTLCNHKLTQGLWLYTFRAMQNTLNLEVLRLKGILHGNASEHGTKDDWVFQGKQHISIKTWIQEYVIGSNDVTLESIIDHGPSCSCRGGPYHDLHR
ncbi:MAG: hypothetical protein Q9221_004854 [Calogaya cf. arnoldii]